MVPALIINVSHYSKIFTLPISLMIKFLSLIITEAQFSFRQLPRQRLWAVSLQVARTSCVSLKPSWNMMSWASCEGLQNAGHFDLFKFQISPFCSCSSESGSDCPASHENTACGGLHWLQLAFRWGSLVTFVGIECLGVQRWTVDTGNQATTMHLNSRSAHPNWMWGCHLK